MIIWYPGTLGTHYAGLPLCSPASVTAALADGLAELLDAWRGALADDDTEALDLLAPLIVDRARLAVRSALRA